MKSKFFTLSTIAAGLIAASASPALLANDASSELERISVTGSYIKRAQNEDATPLQIIDASDISASGEITLTDLLRDLTVNTGNSYDEQYTSSFSAGSASVGLRGLSPKNTLILVNGQRVSNYGFALGTQDTFVDLNALPLGAVERIEVLKDGASAVYGSDAIAGVINIILRNNVQSTQFRAGVGGASEGSLTQYSAGVISGFGDIAGDGYNLTFSYDYLTRERLNADDRDFTRSGDFRDPHHDRSLLADVLRTRHHGQDLPYLPGDHHRRPDLLAHRELLHPAGPPRPHERQAARLVPAAGRPAPHRCLAPLRAIRRRSLCGGAHASARVALRRLRGRLGPLHDHDRPDRSPHRPIQLLPQA